jgi:predicted DNA-binding protein
MERLKVSTTVRLDRELFAALKGISSETDVPYSEYIRQAIEEWLQRREKALKRRTRRTETAQIREMSTEATREPEAGSETSTAWLQQILEDEE